MMKLHPRYGAALLALALISPPCFVAGRVMADPPKGEQPKADKAKDDKAKGARTEDDKVIEEKLDRRLPEINFNGNDFSDVIDFLRDVTGTNISVNWNTLEAAGVKKDTAVTIRLRNVKFRTALKVILDAISPANAKVVWTLTDDVIVISAVDGPKP